MLSLKEKLLQRPWTEKKYKNHRKKVLSAYPAIDNKPPETRKHVTIKQKKIQNENERSFKIEKDNFLLLKKLCWIMNSNRVDNYWSEPLPNFLSRVNIYDKHVTKNKEVKADDKENMYLGQNIKCFACALQKNIPVATPEVSEERKLSHSLKFHGDNTVTRKSTSSPPTISKKKQTDSKQKRISKSAPPLKKQSSKEPPKVSSKIKKHEINRNESVDNSSLKTTTNRTNNNTKLHYRNECAKYYNSIILNKGSLILSVNFPSGTSVKLRDGKNEKILLKGLCGCKNNTKIC